MNETSAHDVDPRTGQPVGLAVDATPARPPQPVSLSGRYGTVERLDPHRHRDSLWDAVRDHPHLFTYMAFGPFADAAAFSDWLSSRRQSSDPYFYAIVQPSGRAVGLAALMSIRPEMRVVEVGNILLEPASPAHAARHRGAISAGAPCLRDARLPPLRVEMRCAQRRIAPRGAALRISLRRHLSRPHDHQGAQPRHRLVRHAGRRLAGAKGRVRTLARAGEFQRRRYSAGAAGRHSVTSSPGLSR